MKAKFLTIALFSCVIAGYAETSPAKLYANLEQRLHALKSLEVRYEAEGTQIAGGTISGRLVWVKPNKFYHDTPEWTLCEIGREQWRYLKTQNTLIRERAQNQEQWTPESVLLDLGKNYRPESVDEQGDGTRVLKLASRDANAPGTVSVEFPPESTVPDQIHFELVDGTVTDYRVTDWNENIKVDDGLFAAPDVPPENVIDFRAATEDTR